MFFCFEPFYVYCFSQMKYQLQSYHWVSALAVFSAWRAFTEDILLLYLIQVFSND